MDAGPKSQDLQSWVDCGTYWLNMADQGTPVWHGVRDCRLTASNFGGATGKSHFKGKAPDDIADGITGIKPITFSAESERIMEIGRKQEPVARNWYCQGKGVQVREVGIAIPKWFPWIGASLDGEVLTSVSVTPSGGPGGPQAGGPGVGMIEIKCPEKMYRPLEEYTQRVAAGWKPPVGYHDHIWSSHYDQMQGCMAICNKKWCDYIVFCEPENKAFVHRLDFDENYWNRSLFPALQQFVDTKLLPRLRRIGKLPVCPQGITLAL